MSFPTIPEAVLWAIYATGVLAWLAAVAAFVGALCAAIRFLAQPR